MSWIGVALKRVISDRVASRVLRVSALAAAVTALSLVVAAVSFAVDAPLWSKGFPRLADKNVLLQWDPVKGAGEYKVYRRDAKEKEAKLVATVKANRHIDKDMAAGKTFVYYVSAVAEGKEGPRSEAASVTTPKEEVFVPLTVPKLVGGNVKMKDVKNFSIGIRWEGGKGTELIGYNVYRSKKKGGGYTLIGSTNTDTYEDEDVKRGEAYYYVVTSVDSSFNETKYSNEVNVDAPEIEKPMTEQKKEETPPTKLRATKLLFTVPKLDMTEEERKEMESKGIPTPGNAQDVVVDEAVGHIYVSSYLAGGILVYDMDGKYQFSIMKDGANGKEKFEAPECLALGPNGMLYVTDFTSPDVYSFDYSGRPQEKIHIDISDMPGRERSTARLFGIQVAGDGTIYVVENVTSRILGFNNKGKQVLEIKNDKRKKIELAGISFMTLTSEGDIAVVDVNSSQIKIFRTDGSHKRTMGKKGLGAGLMYYPVGIAKGNNGELFSASGKSPNIQAFSNKGEFLYLIAGESFDDPPPVQDMRGVYVDGKDRLYIADGLAGRLVVLQMLDKYGEIVPEK